MLATRPQQPVASTSAIPYSSPTAPKLKRSRSRSSSAAPTPQRGSAGGPLLVNGTLVQPDQLETSGGRIKKYKCTHEGCGKSFTRPVRLEEHQRSHTGERPFACPSCSSTFARDSHLKAHLRTHASEEDKPLKCEECEKRFWTNQHLKKHVEVVHKGKTYDCPSCPLSFRKHNLLRTHIAEAHSPAGTNPFICDHPGCDKSFKQMVHLKAHVKIHDPSRYLCHHPACVPLPLVSRQYPTWSALQRHTKTAHPPTCPHPECKGRTFTSNRGLKGHLAGHYKKDGEGNTEEGGESSGARKRKRGAEGAKRKRRKKGRSSEDETTAQETEMETDLDAVPATLSPILGSPAAATAEISDQEKDSEEDESMQEAMRDARMVHDFAWGGKRKRKIGARMIAEAEAEEADGEGEDEVEDMEAGSDAFGPSSPWRCEMGRCQRSFKSSDALETHQLTAHPAPSSFVYVPDPALPPLPDLPTAGALDPTGSYDFTTSTEDEAILAPPGVSFIDLLTGRGYEPTDSEREVDVESRQNADGAKAKKRRYACPFPEILDVGLRLPASPASVSKPRPDPSSRNAEPATVDEDEPCTFRFSRIYDMERHLRSKHRVGVERLDLEKWFESVEEESETDGEATSEE